MPSTIVDVANLAGVSPSTVSHVVNGTRFVSEGTKERVLEAIEATSYMPDALARSIRRDRSESVGLIVSDAAQSIFAEMILGVEEEARARGLVLLLANSGADPAREMESVRTFRKRRVEGLLVAEVAHRPNEIAQYLKSKGIPLVLLDRVSEPAYDQVGVGTQEPMRSLVGHVLELGHTRIALIAGDTSIPTLRDRAHHFQAAMREAGFPPEAIGVVDSVPTQADAANAVAKLMSTAGSTRPTALVSASLNMTVGTLTAIRRLGLRVPADVSVVSFDKLPYDDLFETSLTGLVQPAFEIGRQAMKLLVRRLQDPNADPATVALTPRLVVGGSSAPPAE
jgi:LacI family transcriptional regulator